MVKSSLFWLRSVFFREEIKFHFIFRVCELFSIFLCYFAEEPLFSFMEFLAVESF